ncbi:MAG: efflux RND transporter periplasmic adaptor subunit [Verrucomicrobia bacterium]|nr:efflux RND transporter periplasmic adaptor subunit [Verrucomicrobiota bacterium]
MNFTPLRTSVLVVIALVVGLLGGALGVSFLRSGGADAPALADGAQVWTCSMHPQVRLPKPGKCPICSMPLILAKSGAKSTGTNAAAASESMLELSDHARAMASVATAVVERRALMHEIRAVGKVQYNETTLAVINSRVDGYIERLYVDFTGVDVQPGDHLVDLYSPDLIVAQQELLIALENRASTNLVASARLKLLRWGLTQAQVDDLTQHRKISERVTLFSPSRGTVTEKMAVQKGMVKAGEMLFRLANLDSVWLYLDVYESELGRVQYGQLVDLTTEAHPGRTFSGRIWFINPVLTEESRTVKVLVNIANTDHALKPGMFASAAIRIPLLSDGRAAPTGVAGQFTCPMHPLVLQPQPGNCKLCGMALTQIPGPTAQPKPDELKVLAVPVAAVLDSGVRTLVYVERAKGQFAPVEVKLGARAGDFYPVLSGLNGGEQVAVRGNFLLDSQFQVQGMPSLFYPQGQAAVSGHQHGGAATPAPVAKPTGHEGHAMPKAAPKPGEHKH